MAENVNDSAKNQDQSPVKHSDYVKCESCGGNMVFDPESQCLKCEHCGRTDEFQKSTEVKEQAIEKAFEESVKWSDETNVYKCENCGAQFIVKADEVAVLCPYCGTSHIVKSDEIAGVKPNAVYPFLLTTAQAANNAKRWARRRIFSPRSFKKNLVENNLHGVFLPCFTFDSDTFSSYNGRVGEHRTRTVRDSKGNTRTESYIEWYNIRGSYSRFFDDIAISSGEMTQSEMYKMMPFKKETLCVYESKFLSGFVADHYTKDVKQCWGLAKEVIDKDLRRDILEKHGGDVIDYLNVSTMHNDVKYKYILLPVYRLNYRFKKKSYPILVNGNSGGVTGKAPISPLRVAIAVILGLGIGVGIGYGVYRFCISEYIDPLDYILADNKNVEMIDENVSNSVSLSEYFENEGYKIKF